MTAFVELPLVSEQAHRSVWVNPDHVVLVSASSPSRPGCCWVQFEMGGREHVALTADAVVDLLLCGRTAADIDLRGEVLENLRRGGPPCTGDPCVCTNGIGCVTVPVERW